MISLKSPREIEIMARGGAILAATLERLSAEVRPGLSTKDLDVVCEDFIRSHEGAKPAFKGLYGFPASACISVNEEIVHGIPSAKRVLKAGDLVKLDVGVQYEGYFTDAAVTVAVGEVDAPSRRLMDVTSAALAAGVDAARVGNHIGDIGAAIEGVVKAAGYTTADDLVGHYVGSKPHGDPQVPNHGIPKRGPKLLAGLTIAIEPMVNIGKSATRTLKDKWTIVTLDGSRSAHFEHTVAVTEAGPRVLTLSGSLVSR
ncbi:MAG TPA: type I methionyl aminopeptidase [Gemmatimonadaceae bacterium]|nr:type I methionyl aminopeptidase [Gemmatimonadaceae bacterium]